jgi:hypothetical protein
MSDRLAVGVRRLPPPTEAAAADPSPDPVRVPSPVGADGEVIVRSPSRALQSATPAARTSDAERVAEAVRAAAAGGVEVVLRDRLATAKVRPAQATPADPDDPVPAGLLARLSGALSSAGYDGVEVVIRPGAPRTAPVALGQSIDPRGIPVGPPTAAGSAAVVQITFPVVRDDTMRRVVSALLDGATDDPFASPDGGDDESAPWWSEPVRVDPTELLIEVDGDASVVGPWPRGGRTG